MIVNYLYIYKQVSKKYVSKEIGVEIRKKAKPFIEWLKEAEEESGEDDEDEDDNIVYSEQVHEEKKKIEDDDDDIDIDNI